MSETIYIIFKVYLIFVIFYFICVNLVYGMFLAFSLKAILNHMRQEALIDYRKLVQSEFTYPVSIIAPAYNEGPTVVESVKSLLKLISILNHV